MADNPKIRPLDVSREIPDARNAGQREASDSGIVDPRKNEILEEHYREHPEGDPAVRRIRPDRGEIPIENVHDGGVMTVDGRPRRREQKKKTG